MNACLCACMYVEGLQAIQEIGNLSLETTPVKRKLVGDTPSTGAPTTSPRKNNSKRSSPKAMHQQSLARSFAAAAISAPDPTQIDTDSDMDHHAAPATPRCSNRPSPPWQKGAPPQKRHRQGHLQTSPNQGFSGLDSEADSDEGDGTALCHARAIVAHRVLVILTLFTGLATDMVATYHLLDRAQAFTTLGAAWFIEMDQGLAQAVGSSWTRRLTDGGGPPFLQVARDVWDLLRNDCFLLRRLLNRIPARALLPFSLEVVHGRTCPRQDALKGNGGCVARRHICFIYSLSSCGWRSNFGPT